MTSASPHLPLSTKSQPSLTHGSPLCIEEFDLSDKNFRPCPCGYQVRGTIPISRPPSLRAAVLLWAITDPPDTMQVCQFCFHNIKSNMNGLCPACRRPYDEKTIQYKVVTAEESVSLS